MDYLDLLNGENVYRCNNFEECVQKELKKAEKAFPDYHSYHEGYAVLKEEIEELDERMEYLKNNLDVYWKMIRSNNVNVFDLEPMIAQVSYMHDELTQVGAILVRHLRLFKEEK